MPLILLIVDDEQEFREALATVFADEYEVHLATNGKEALALLDTVAADLILLDIVMPGMDGFQTCLRLRQMEHTRQIPVIFLTSKLEPETETFGLELGADDFVTKPFNRDVLRARVKKRLGDAAAPDGAETTELEDYTIH
ncbi:MAG: response regulator, partial [bacterium]